MRVYTDSNDLRWVLPSCLQAAAARPGATRQPAPPFCNEVRYQKGDYAKYFKLIFSNKTFRVYRVA